MRHGVMAVLALAGTPAAAGAAPAADYVAIRRTAEVAGTPEAVWAKIGDFCTISRLLDVTCRYAAGQGDLGSMRSLNDGATLEPMIARTSRSYTYGQVKGTMQDYDYHGTLAVEPAGRGRTTIVYTLTYDQARMPSDQVRAEQRARIEPRFQGAVERAKALVEGRPATAP